MNTIVSIPVVAAAVQATESIASPSIAGAAEPNERAGITARAQQVVDLLRTRYIREGWKIDEPAAERAVAFCRRYEEDGSELDEEREVTLNFFHDHGISLDWVFFGDVAGLICGAATMSKRAGELADASLRALCDDYAAAHKRYCDLVSSVGDMESQFRGAPKDKPLPETLYWRDHDAVLGLPMPDLRQGRPNPAWSMPIDVEGLRAARWGVGTRDGVAGVDEVITFRTVVPSEAARARADEIIAAFDDWWFGGRKPPRGFKKALRERDRAYNARERIEAAIAKTRASSFEGMRAKTRCAFLYEHAARLEDLEDYFGEGGATTAMVTSILRDVERLAG